MSKNEHELTMDNVWNDNQIGDSGTCSIGEGLKMNSTLTELDLSEALINDIMK